MRTFVKAPPLRKVAFALFTAVVFLVQTMVAAAAENIGCNVQIETSDDTGMTLLIEIQDIIIEPDVSGKVSVSIPGESSSGIPGQIDLPHLSRLIAVPPGTRVRADAVVEDRRIIPSSEPRSVASRSPSGAFNWRESLTTNYNAGSGPTPLVEVSEPMIMRGITIVNMTVNPLAYDPVHCEIDAVDRLRVRLDYEPLPDDNPRRASASRATPQVVEMAKSMVLNPNDVMVHRDTPEGSYLFVIPAYDGVAAAIQPLVDLRVKQGHQTQVMTIANNTSNRELRDMLLDAYFEWDNPPEVVTLVGEADLAPPAQFMIPTWDVGGAFMWETDYKYALLEGDDLLPELAIGRLSARNLNELSMMINKIVTYETAPEMQDPEWLRSAALMSNDQQTGYSSIYLQRWARKMMLEVGFTMVDTLYFLYNPSQQESHNFMERNFNNGITLFNYRGWGDFGGAWSIGDARGLNNRNKLPLLILPTCNTGDFADHVLAPHSFAEDFLWAPNGAVGVIGSSGFTHTNYNNVFDGGILNGLLRDRNWRFGWALNQGKVELYRHFGAYNDVADPQVRNLLIWEAHCYQFNLIGDPGTELWTAVPNAFDVEAPANLTLGENRLPMNVLDMVSEEPVEGALVTLVLDGRIIRKSLTDAAGSVLFAFAAGELAEETYSLTVSKHDFLPCFNELIVMAGNRFVGFSSVVIDDDRAGVSLGNSDGNANPGERLELRAYVRQFGANVVQGAVDFTLQALEGDVEIVNGNARLNNAPAAGDSGMVTFVVDVGQQNWNNRRISFLLTGNVGQERWESLISFPAKAPDLKFVSHEFSPADFNTGDTAWVDVTLENTGGLASLALSARLISNREVVNVFNDRAEYAPMDPEGNNTASARFRIHSHTLTVPGTEVGMTIQLEDANGFQDTTRFSFVVGQARQGTPFGPDAYGYVCFDNTDVAWAEGCPTYRWIEIDTALGGPGTDTDIGDYGNEQDWTALVDLPFPFKYYGREDIRQVSICSNGWFALGDESKLADFQNRRIPPALGPRAQVCVFWDDLISYRDDNRNRIGGVFYWHDEDSSRFIIEWSRMRRYVGMDGNRIVPGSENTFQAILYDPQHYPTYTGDGEIVFQYHTVHNDPQVDPLEYDTPYATVGIVNLNGTDGMEYTYFNEYTPGAAPLVDGRAIKFSTVLVVAVGRVTGDVTDLATGQPIEGAEIRGSRGSFTLTNRSGNFNMDHVLIGENYSFTAWAPGYNDSTQTGFDVLEDSTITLSFALRHPVFDLSVASVEERVQPNFGVTLRPMLTNTGNGPLQFSTTFDYYGGGDHHLWQRLLDIRVTDITQDSRIQGVDFRGDHFWVIGANNRDNPNKFYLFDRRGRHVRSIDQPGASAYGFRGTTVMNNILYGGDGPWILGVDMEGVIVDSIPAPFDPVLAIAHDSEDFFYIAGGRQQPLTRLDQFGNIFFTWEHELDIQGLGWLRDDPDGFPVYIFSADKTNPALEVPFILVSKFNPQTGAFRTVTVLEGNQYDRAGGMEIINGYDPTKWVMATVMGNPNGDRISVYDMGPNTDWIDLVPRFNTVPPGATIPLRLELSAAGLTVGDFQLTLRFKHNAAGLSTNVPVILHVDSTAVVDEPGLLPTEFTLSQNYPNPFNAATTIPFSLPVASMTRMTIFDVTGREVARLVDGRLEAGLHRAAFNAEGLASGVYLIELTSGGQQARIKLALLK